MTGRWEWGPHDTVAGQGAGLRRQWFLDDLIFYDTTGYACVNGFDIRRRQGRIRVVSRGTVADFGQFSLEKDDARSHQASRQGIEFAALKFQGIETGRPVAGFADGRPERHRRHAGPVTAQNNKGGTGLRRSASKSAAAIHVRSGNSESRRIDQAERDHPADRHQADRWCLGRRHGRPSFSSRCCKI